MNEKYYKVSKFGNGWIIRPLDSVDGHRWYFDTEAEAIDYAAYLERSE
jgi:hypothetical protein